MRPPAITFPTPAHEALADRTVEVLRTDERVVAVFIGGSVVTGESDEESDLDLTVIMDDAGLDSFWEGIERWFHSVGRPVAVAPGPIPLATALMHDGLRLDLAVVARSALASHPRRPMIALHDPYGTAVGLEFASPRFEPTPEWLDGHVRDFLRFLDQLTVVVVRREWIAGIDNAWYLVSRLLDLYAHSNRAPRTSPRRVNARLTPTQQLAVEALAPIRANPASIVAVHVRVATLYRIEARTLADKVGMEWPTELENAVVDHLRVRTGAEFVS